MDEPNWDEMELREIITYAPPGGVFHPRDYPWLAYARIAARGGDGGASSDGNPGRPGTTEIRLLSREQLPEVVTVTVGRGHAGSGGEPGRDGFVLIELWAAKQV